MFDKILGGVGKLLGGAAAEIVGAIIPGESKFEDMLKTFIGKGGLAALLSGGSLLPAILGTLLEETGAMSAATEQAEAITGELGPLLQQLLGGLGTDPA
jgi:hypothetical protein